MVGWEVAIIGCSLVSWLILGLSSFLHNDGDWWLAWFWFKINGNRLKLIFNVVNNRSVFCSWTCCCVLKLEQIVSVVTFTIFSTNFSTFSNIFFTSSLRLLFSFLIRWISAFSSITPFACFSARSSTTESRELVSVNSDENKLALA